MSARNYISDIIFSTIAVLLLLVMVYILANRAYAYTCADDKRMGNDGDSFSYWDDPSRGPGLSAPLNAMTGNCAPLVYNGGVGGQRSDEILQDFHRVVARSNVQIVRLYAGHNDIRQDYGALWAEQNVAAMIDYTLANGKKIIVHTVPEPSDCWGGAQSFCDHARQQRYQYNEWLLDQDGGFVCVVNNDVGPWAITFDDYRDGIHYNDSGAYKAAKNEIKQCWIPWGYVNP